VIEVPYVPTSAFAGTVTEMVGFQLAEFNPETPVADCTAAGGYSAFRSLPATAAVPVTLVGPAV
jgi:NADPH:quinone reductase-like Zn-dependent oxidoreductase